jgi:hypothetical protein
MITRLLLLQCLLISLNFCIAQNYRKEKFGDVKLEDFKPNSPILNDDDAAVILFDIGNTEFVGNSSGWFDLVFKRHKKILIKKRTAFDLATINERLYKGNYTINEQMDDIKAATYNLIDGKIETTILEVKKDVLKEQINKSFEEQKFTLPNIKEGCVIEYSYTIKTKDVRDLRSWRFQDIYPTIWSEYQVTIPPIFNYIQDRKGYFNKYTLDSNKSVYKSYNITEDNGLRGSDYFTVSGNAPWALWARKDIEAFKEEGFTSSIRNYLSGIEFHLQSINYSETNRNIIIKDWYNTVQKLLDAEYFGKIFDAEKNSWIETEAKAIIGNSKDEEAANKVFNYFKNNFNCNGSRSFTLSKDAKKIWQEKLGDVGDVNLLLTAFLYHLGFKSSPVILSTRSYGKPDQIRAILYQFNYVITELEINNKKYLLDASNKYLGFGQLPIECYNGFGRKIEKMPVLVNLDSDSLQEVKTTAIFIVNSEKKGKLEASFTSNLGTYESAEQREKYTKLGKEAYFKQFEKAYMFPIKLSNEGVENEKELDQPLNIKYDFETDINDEDIIYFSPLLSEATTKNPFKSATRNYPVEMPYCTDETIIVDMEVPIGYKIDERPKSEKYKLYEDSDDCMFEYIVVVKENKIQLRTRISIKKSIFLPEDYEALRNFWSVVVKKHAEQIVFKKIKQ